MAWNLSPWWPSLAVHTGLVSVVFSQFLTPCEPAPPQLPTARLISRIEVLIQPLLTKRFGFSELSGWEQQVCVAGGRRREAASAWNSRQPFSFLSFLSYSLLPHGACRWKHADPRGAAQTGTAGSFLLSAHGFVFPDEFTFEFCAHRLTFLFCRTVGFWLFFSLSSFLFWEDNLLLRLMFIQPWQECSHQETWPIWNNSKKGRWRGS